MHCDNDQQQNSDYATENWQKGTGVLETIMISIVEQFSIYVTCCHIMFNSSVYMSLCFAKGENLL